MFQMCGREGQAHGDRLRVDVDEFVRLRSVANSLWNYTRQGLFGVGKGLYWTWKLLAVQRRDVTLHHELHGSDFCYHWDPF